MYIYIFNIYIYIYVYIYILIRAWPVNFFLLANTDDFIFSLLVTDADTDIFALLK